MRQLSCRTLLMTYFRTDTLRQRRQDNARHANQLTEDIVPHAILLAEDPFVLAGGVDLLAFACSECLGGRLLACRGCRSLPARGDGAGGGGGVGIGIAAGEDIRAGTASHTAGVVEDAHSVALRASTLWVIRRVSRFGVAALGACAVDIRPGAVDVTHCPAKGDVNCFGCSKLAVQVGGAGPVMGNIGLTGFVGDWRAVEY